ncbi:MAG: hypothetical protein LWW99_08070 [Deltaproteobacteria bacterium]|nr:hypothetical protein [Deltaproteobacteria bacterium]
MILTMLKRKGKIADDLIQKLMNWRPSMKIRHPLAILARHTDRRTQTRVICQTGKWPDSHFLYAILLEKTSVFVCASPRLIQKVFSRFVSIQDALGWLIVGKF